jgi:dTDP-glucose 4,6-dehydratase
VVNSVLDQLGKPRSLIQFVEGSTHDRRYAIDPSLAESELGWQPRETWETGYTRPSWYQESPSWIARAGAALREYYAQQYGTEVGAS